MEIPEGYVIEAFRRLGFYLVEQDPRYRVFVDKDSMEFFLPVLDGGMMQLVFMLQDMETTEGIEGMELGWTRETWLPTLAEVLKGTEFELDVDYTTED